MDTQSKPKMDDRLEMDIWVTAKGAVTGEQNKASVYSSGVLAASSEEPMCSAANRRRSGRLAFLAPSVAADGRPDTQAGEFTPRGLTTTVAPNTIMQLSG